MGDSTTCVKGTCHLGIDRGTETRTQCALARYGPHSRAVCMHWSVMQLCSLQVLHIDWFVLQRRYAYAFASLPAQVHRWGVRMTGWRRLSLVLPNSGLQCCRTSSYPWPRKYCTRQNHMTKSVWTQTGLSTPIINSWCLREGQTRRGCSQDTASGRCDTERPSGVYPRPQQQQWCARRHRNSECYTNN